MNTLQAHKLLREQLDKHELYRVEAKMNNRLTNAFGQYKYSTLYHYKVVELSTKLVELNDEDRVLQTILHEIAHALTEGHNHDEVWRRKCIEIGGDGERCYNHQNTNVIERKRTLYQAFCPEHGNRGRFYRRMNRACGSCCAKYNNGKYSEEYRLEFREIS
jgi:predicted SprT family Zn-dependent metalloprotease